MTINTRFTWLVLVLETVAATPACGQRSAERLPAVPNVRAPLQMRERYPVPGATIAAGDSTFIFGSLGNGNATLTIAGQPVEVAPNGGWLAWLRIPSDTAFALRLEAHLGDDTTVINLPLRRATRSLGAGGLVDPSSMSPAGAVWLPPGEALVLSVRARANARVALHLPDGTIVPFVADSQLPAVAAGIRAFDRDPANLRRVPSGERYVAVWRGAATAPAAGLLDSTAPGRRPVLHVSVDGADVIRTEWPLELRRSASMAVTLHDDRGDAGGTDRTIIGRTTPGGTYAWFFPNGTTTWADARIGDDVRLRLSGDAVAWVSRADVQRRPAADDPRLARMGSLMLTADSGFVRLRIPLATPVPAQVVQGLDHLRLTLFGAVGDADWTRYGATSSFVRLLTWRQVAADRVELQLDLSRPLWGWRLFVDGSDLVLDVRQPPPIRIASPLRGRSIVIDPGHPPLGACGPTGVCEPEVNLAIARRVRDRLTALGAKVTMTRDDGAPIGLWPRVAIADSVGAEVLISIHNNALPDGVNPFTNSGSSTFFNHPHALPLAQAVQRRLVARLGLRDLGVARGDLALVRPTWYPAILTEGLFMMIPRQEAAVASRTGQTSYAAAIVEGLEGWLRDVAQQEMAGGQP